MKTIGLLLGICVSAFFICCAELNQKARLYIMTTEGINGYDTVSCYVKQRSRERLLYQTFNPLSIDTVRYESKHKKLFIVEEEIMMQEETSTYLVYDAANSRLYESDYNSALIFLSAEEQAELSDRYRDYWAQGNPEPISTWDADSVSPDFSKIFIRYWNGRVNELNLKEISIPSKL